jgi:TonB family protein
MALDCMNRLQQKCFIASALFHLLLVLTLLLGSAFRSPVRQPGNSPEIQLVTLPAGSEFLALAQPLPGHTARPNSAAGTVQETNPPGAEREAVPTTSEPRSKLPRISLTPVFRPLGGKPISNRPTAADSGVAAIDHVLKALEHGLAPSTAIESTSSGGGNDAQAYAQIVKEAYTRSWNPSGSDVTKEDAVTKVSVTIANDGRVLSAQITEPSSDAQADRSVQRTLKDVSCIRAFEPGAREKQRTYTINFNLNAKRSGN